MNREATAEWFQYSRVLFRQQQQLQKTLVEVRATHHDVSHARIKYDTLKKKKRRGNFGTRAKWWH